MTIVYMKNGKEATAEECLIQRKFFCLSSLEYLCNAAYPIYDKYYIKTPTHEPVHSAAVWDRYNQNPKYFGGIVSFNSSMFNTINGYPNNFWGWGGEDDELYKRTKKRRV